MKKKTKPFLSLLLALTLLLSAAPLSRLADVDWHLLDLSRLFSSSSHAATIVDSGKEGDMKWTLDEDGLLTVSGKGEMTPFLRPDDNNVEIKKVVLENGVTSIEAYSFQGWENLIDITIPNSVTSIGMYAFQGCLSLKKIIIPNSVTDIGIYSFFYCTALTNITISNSLKSIGYGAFIGCSSLRDVYFTGNESEWKVIKKADGNTPLTSATIHYNSTGPLSTYVLAYDANGGGDAPAEQIKTEKEALILSGDVPVKTYQLTYNANGGSVAAAGKTVDILFKSWNTKADGSGESYAPGGTYNADADVTLYAQWEDPAAGALAVPTRSGYAFEGWFTAADGGTQVTESTTVTASQTVYAHWNNPYNRGEETYGFKNFRDGDAPGGHCHGMSVTSTGYYLGILDVEKIGLHTPQELYAASFSKTVTDPICYYQPIQGGYLSGAIVAGHEGTVSEQWRSAVDYVKDHSFDGTGALTVTIRTYVDGTQYGHALTFLRYEKVNGQDRIYAYDNETPTFDTYFYLTAEGIRQGPEGAAYAPYPINYKFDLNDVATYFENAKSYDPTHAFYAAKGSVEVKDVEGSYMLCGVGETPWLMYEFPADAKEVTVTPLTDDAAFTYMGKEYTFGKIADDTYATLTLAETEGETPAEPEFVIHEETTGVPGDVSGDGVVTAEDARLALRAAVGLENYEEGSAEFLAADATKDGAITAEDARLILRAAVGLDTLT